MIFIGWLILKQPTGERYYILASGENSANITLFRETVSNCGKHRYSKFKILKTLCMPTVTSAYLH